MVADLHAQGCQAIDHNHGSPRSISKRAMSGERSIHANGWEEIPPKMG